MTDNDEPVVITVVSSEEDREKALDFITQMISEWYQCKRPPTPDILFAAWHNTSIVGTVAFDFGDEQHPVSLQGFYRFDYTRTPWPVEKQKVAQYIRWAATQPNVSIALMYFSACYGIARGKNYVFCEVKGLVGKRLRQLQIDLRPIPGALLNLKDIPESILPYYTLPPEPTFCMVSLQQMADVLQERVERLVHEHKLILHFDHQTQSSLMRP